LGTYGKGIVGDFGKTANFFAFKNAWVQAALSVYRNMAFNKRIDTRLDMVLRGRDCDVWDYRLESAFEVEKQ
jgi:hypothetical protein